MTLDEAFICFKYDNNYNTVRALNKDGEVWFLARSILDCLDLGYLSVEEFPEMLSKLDPDTVSSAKVNLYGKEKEVDLINISGIKDLDSLWLDDHWNNTEKNVQKFLGWIRDKNILLQILNQTVTAN